MKLLFQFFIIIVISFVGELLNRFIPLPIPASIYGIVILFVALKMKWVKESHISEVCSFLIAIMPVLFIPAAVGLVESWSVISENLVKYILILIISTIVVMAVSGLVTQYVIKHGKEKPQ